MKLKLFVFVLALIIVLAAVLRLYRFSEPIADWHSWRQVDTAAVARNFVTLGFDPLRPQYDDSSNIQSGKDNPSGYRMVEFPVYQILGYGVYSLVPIFTIEQSLRIISILSSLITLVCIAYLGRELHGQITGLLSAFVYAVLPYSVFYGRSILPEPLMICLSIVSVVLMYIAGKGSTKHFFILAFLSSIAAGISLLVKPYAVFILIPSLFLFLHRMLKDMTTFRSFREYLFTLLYVFLLICLVILPLLLWRQWILAFPEGIPVSSWLFNEGNIRFKGAWFHWLFKERIGGLMLGTWGIGFLLLGMIKPIKRYGYILWGWVLGVLLFLTIFARGNVQHDYYQQPLLPILSLFVGIGFCSFLEITSWRQRFVRLSMYIVVFLFMLAFSWYDVRGFFWINHPEIVEAGKTANSMLPKDAKVIAPYNGDTTFLYQTRRQGWPIGFEIDKKIAQGATHYVTVSTGKEDGETQDLLSRYKTVIQTDQFIILDLRTSL